MKGKFIGKTSMGFKHGSVYDIHSDIRNIRKGNGIPEKIAVRDVPCTFGDTGDMICICIYDEHSSAWCPYQSLESLLRNWEIKL